jgi:hypothetical protein
MRLTDLDPCWVGAGGEGISDAQGQPVPERHGVGLGFDCPCGCGDRSYIYFSNPLDGGPPARSAGPNWERTGDTFETLTVTPSIQRVGGCNWHGFITNGGIHRA